MIDIKKIFLENRAPDGFMDWAYELTYEEIINTCDNEIWLLWIIEKAKGRQDLGFIKTIALCVDYFRQYLTLPEGLSALAAAYNFVEGIITIEDLNASLDIADIKRQELALKAAVASEEDYYIMEVEALLLCSMYPENHSNYRQASELIKLKIDANHDHELCMQNILSIIKETNKI